MKKHISKIGSIVFSTSVVIFSLAAAFSGTIAWFNLSKTATVNAGSFQVVAPEGLAYDLYFLDHFDLDPSGTKGGNYNDIVGEYIGYEVPNGTASFTQITYTGNVVDPVHEKDPTDIRHLWPNHYLTFALVISTGTVSNFKLTSWTDNRNDSIKNDSSQSISLTWATNIYSNAYYVADSNDSPNLASGYNSFLTDINGGTVTDKFTYDEDHDIPAEISFFNNVSGESGTNKHIIVYFSIEFSNASSTFYEYDQTHDYYVNYNKSQKVDKSNFNSNCYRTLSLSNLLFSLS